MSNKAPVPLTDADDEFTFKSCCTELFRWVRASAEFIEQTPDYFTELARDVEQAWHDSAKK